MPSGRAGDGAARAPRFIILPILSIMFIFLNLAPVDLPRSLDGLCGPSGGIVLSSRPCASITCENFLRSIRPSLAPSTAAR